MRSERHVATPKTGLPHAPTRGFGAVQSEKRKRVAIPFLAVWNLATCSKHEALYIAQVSWVLFKQQAFNATVQHVDVCVILPAFCGFMVSGELLKQLGAFRASCRNPKNRIATRSNAWIWRARFWSRLLLK